MSNQNNNGSTKGVAGDRVSVGVWKKVFDRDGTEVRYANGKFRLGDLLDIANGDPEAQISLSYFPATTKKTDRSPDANVLLKVFVPRDNNGGGGGWNNSPKQGQRTQQAPRTNGGGGYRKQNGGGQGGGNATQTRTRQQVPTQQAQAQYDDDNGGDDQQAGNSAPW